MLSSVFKILYDEDKQTGYIKCDNPLCIKKNLCVIKLFDPLLLLFNVTHMKELGSSLIYNTSARHERHECSTNATRTIRVRHG